MSTNERDNVSMFQPSDDFIASLIVGKSCYGLLHYLISFAKNNTRGAGFVFCGLINKPAWPCIDGVEFLMNAGFFPGIDGLYCTLLTPISLKPNCISCWGWLVHPSACCSRSWSGYATWRIPYSVPPMLILAFDSRSTETERRVCCHNWLLYSWWHYSRRLGTLSRSCLCRPWSTQGILWPSGEHVPRHSKKPFGNRQLKLIKPSVIALVKEFISSDNPECDAVFKPVRDKLLAILPRM